MPSFPHVPADRPALPTWLADALHVHRNHSYPEYILHRRQSLAHRTALVFENRKLSYEQLAASVDSAAGILQRHYGLRAGDRVVICAENSDLYVIAYFAVLRAGCVAVPVNPKLTPHELAYLVNDCSAALFMHAGLPAEFLGQLAGLFDRQVPLATLDLAPTGDAQDHTAPETPDPDAAAVIFYTSGTTGKPKGVIHTHRTLIAGALQAAHAWGYAREDLVNLAITPLFHVASHSWSYPTLAHGGTLVVDTYSTERIFDLIERHRVQGFGCVPAMLLMMLRSEARVGRDLSSVINVRFGASPMPAERLAEVQGLFPNAQLYHGMGQTESCGTISVLPGALALDKAGSTGWPLPGCEVRIVDDEGRDVAPGERGEVLARSPSVMIGYFGRTQETQETLRDGWLHTGDVGYRDAQGLIYLVDRKKDMIIRGGENIYSVEIEHVLALHARVESCAIIGMPDDLMGERVGAVVVVRGGQPEAGGVSQSLADELKAWCRARLAHFKVPEEIFFVNSLPQTATGKIQKGVLRQQLLAARESATRAAMGSHV
ncbi:hypothetical protein CAL18_14720 [Bordetella genomosp. 7]|uniref:class I adenylate-forming enzyme family protein n=1 Tax=Bordetella genomosp. 7 TaxID=1416805 RepID=UPI000B9E91A8|nr:AMP-binding protein [Bordetella genomosp. 7]OZI17382.1 hypothetical protein CAL18_14720 [Bordetella genomosp. 7]